MTATPPPAQAAGNKGNEQGFLSRVRTKGLGYPKSMIINGTPGIGKTSMAAHSKNVIFGFPADEMGLSTLIDSGQLPETPYLPPWKTWKEVLNSLNELIEKPHDYKTFVGDGFGSIERLCHEHVCRRDYNNDWGKKGFTSYMAGYDTALADWREFLSLLDRLRHERNMGIILLAHTKISPFRNPLGDDFDRFTVECHHKTWSLTSKWADIVLFANYHVETVKSNDSSKAKGLGGKSRVLHTEYEAAWDAKNRLGLPEEIEMGNSGQEAWNNFISAMKTKRGDA